MKIRSILTFILAVSMLLTSTTAVFASAKNVVDNSKTTSKISAKEQKLIDKRVKLIEKMTPYVSLNPETKQYELVTTKNNLSKSEIDETNALIDISNEKIREAISQNMILTVTPENTLKGTSSVNTGGIQIAYINTSAYWDYEFLWWGERVFLSNNLVNDLEDWGNSVLYTVGITMAGMRSALIWLGLSSGWAGFIVSLFGGVVTYTYDRIVNSNTGYGVYCDSYYGLNYWKIYSAW